ncbi:serine hydrolase domain-containing protein [Flavobacteriaceae bacterium LMO-SS05]|jgi:beta-lactamase class C
MQRPKILGKPILLIVVLFVLTISVFKSESANDEELTSENIKIVDQKALKLYKEHQHELKVALNAYFDKAIASGEIVGAGVGIVKGDSIVFSDGFGKRNAATKGGVDGNTVFRLGSLSKGFTGVLAASLVKEGKLKWTDKVSDFVPGFQLGDPTNTNQITLANILSHTSGAPYHSYTNLIEAGLSMSEIAKRFKSVRPISKPGLTYSYQNAMFALSSEMMHQATHKDFKALLKDKFFKPLGMDHTSMDYETLSHEQNVALPHSKMSKSWKTLKLTNHYDNAVAAGGINSSALDMSKWMSFLLGHHQEIMDKTNFEEAFKPFIELKGTSKYYQQWPEQVSSYYGFGWRIQKFVDKDVQKTIIHHGGSVNDYRNEIALYPEADLGICVLLNSNSKLAKTVIPDIYKIVNEIFNKTSPKATLENHEIVNSTP